jgi:excisionase family DNA binding protein
MTVNKKSPDPKTYRNDVAELMTLREVASYLKVTEKTIHRMLKQEAIPAVRVGHLWRFNSRAIDRWLKKGEASRRRKILVIDDEKVIRTLIKETLEELGHEVALAESGAEGLKLVKEQDLDLVFLDLKMPGMDGAEVFKHIKSIKPKLSVIIITGYPESDIMARALSHGPFEIMNKPFSESDVISAVSNFIRIANR